MSTESYTLTRDEVLGLRVEQELQSSVTRWLPFSARSVPDVASEVVIDVRRRCAKSEKPPTFRHAPTLRLGRVNVWVDDDAAQAYLQSDGGISGEIDFTSLTAVIEAETTTVGDVDLYTALTLSTALLFNRIGRALVHAAAVSPPSGDAWILIGDTHAGKTTTTVNLSSAGWQYLSDDHIVLRKAGSHIEVEGWPRTFHLDPGWKCGAPQGGVREDTDPRILLTDRWRPHAPLAGLLFPRVVPDASTQLTSITRADAFALLVRQSPWLLADRVTAPSILSLLTAATQHPVYQLTLGLDSYADVSCLLARLSDVIV